VPRRKQEILEAALAIADERGLAAVTMRAVAERVGVSPMALYGHVNGKDGLLDDMVGQLLGGITLPPRDQPWQSRLMALAGEARQLVRRHPGASALLFARPTVTPDAVRVVDAIYLALLDAGVPPEDIPRVERLVSTFVLGYAVSEASGRFAADTVDSRVSRAHGTEDQLSGHAQLVRWLTQPVDWDAEFEADLAALATLVAGLARPASEVSAPPGDPGIRAPGLVRGGHP